LSFTCRDKSLRTSFSLKDFVSWSSCIIFWLRIVFVPTV
jgi:hypothetical protein